MDYLEDVVNDMRRDLSEILPPDAKISSIEFEGPFLVLYSKAPDLLMENGGTIKTLAKRLRKRIVIRSDVNVRMPPEEAEKLIYEIANEAEITDMNFDEMLGEVTIEAKKPGLVIGQSGNILRQITKTTFWRPKVVRTLPMRSSIISSIRSINQKESIPRRIGLLNIGKRIHRPLLYPDSEFVRITPLGGAAEIGRSAILMETKESKILVDCGMAVGTNEPNEFAPRLDAPEFDIETLDAVIVTHAHLDHSGYVPYLYKYGYSGPVYCNDATLSLMTLLQKDYLETAEQMEDMILPYSQRDIIKTIIHTVPRRYGEVTDIAPDIRLTLSPAGHILGSALVHIHVGDGKNNIVFAHDFKFGKNRLLTPANAKFPRLETLIMESTYGASRDTLPSRRESERTLLDIVQRTLKRGGKVLIPSMAVGRVQELMITLDHFINNKFLPRDVPIYLDGTINEAAAIYCTFPEYLAPDLQNTIFTGNNPFMAEWFVPVSDRNKRREAIDEKGPAIILTPSEMLTGGPSVEYFHNLAPNSKNSIIFYKFPESSASGDKTLGKRVASGAKEIRWYSGGKARATEVNMEVQVIDGFSGHSDRTQLMNYIRKVTPKPKKILFVHGALQKSLAIAEASQSRHRIPSSVLQNLESIRLG